MSNFVNLLDIIYPVHSMYITTSTVSPATSIGGTWTQITNGACIAAYKDTSGYTGSKTISISQMPRHNHPLVNNLGCGWEANSRTGDRLYYGKYNAGRILREFGDSALQGEGKDYIPYSYACKVYVRTA